MRPLWQGEKWKIVKFFTSFRSRLKVFMLLPGNAESDQNLGLGSSREQELRHDQFQIREIVRKSASLRVMKINDPSQSNRSARLRESRSLGWMENKGRD